MNDTVREFRDFFVSLKLTIALLVLSMVLIFAATLDQVNLGVWAVQEKYFRSLFVLAHFGDIPVPVFPGGYLVGGLLLINLLAAHIYRFKLSWRKLGILITHAGLILLLLGELFSGLMQKEYEMRIDQGETKNYSESYRDTELAIVDTTNPKFDEVVAVPDDLLAKGTPIQSARLPFRVVPRAYYPNASRPQMRTDVPNAPPSLATTGLGPSMVAFPAPISYKQDDRNFPLAYIELVAPEGSLGTWLVSTWLIGSQHFDYGGHSWRIALRPVRRYFPFSLTLLKFSNDIYPGTNIPKNYSSRVRLTTPDAHEDREVLIYMNNPLRYAGLTFYQASFDNDNKTTILQVVRNPSWLIPYISCSMIAGGLVVQFLLHLVGFMGRRRRTVPTANGSPALHPSSS